MDLEYFSCPCTYALLRFFCSQFNQYFCWHAVYSDLADAHDLLKLGGSDYHGRGGQHESDVGSSSLPVLAVHEFLKVARPIWRKAIRDILQNYIRDPSNLNLQHIIRFGRAKSNLPLSTPTLGNADELINQCLTSWLSKEERENAEFETIKAEISQAIVIRGDAEAHVGST